MLKSFSRIAKSNILRSCGVNECLNNSFHYETTRWRRKPRWLPVAKSKQFRVPERKKIPKEEEVEMKRLNDHYRTAIRSLRTYFASKTKETTTAPEFLAEQKRIEDDEHTLCLKINGEWNASVAKLRESRMEAEREKERLAILQFIQDKENEMAKRKALLENLVREEKEKSASFITNENIDSAIEASLTELKDFNFSIDLGGNKFIGRTTKPTEVKANDLSDEKQAEAVN